MAAGGGGKAAGRGPRAVLITLPHRPELTDGDALHAHCLSVAAAAVCIGVSELKSTIV